MFNKFSKIFVSSFFLSKIYYYRKFKRFHLGIFWTFFPTLIVLIGAIISSKQIDFTDFGFEYNFVLWSIPAFVIFRAITETFDISQKIVQLSFILQRSLNIKSFHIFISCIFASCFHLILDLILIFLIFVFIFDGLFFNLILYLYIFSFSIILSVFISIIIGPFAMLIYDLRFISKFLRVIILACTPIFYISPKEGLVSYLNSFNPFTIIIESSRGALLNGLNLEFFKIFLFSPILILLIMFYLKIFSKHIQIINSTPVKGVVGQTYAWVNIFRTKLTDKK